MTNIFAAEGLPLPLPRPQAQAQALPLPPDLTYAKPRLSWYAVDCIW
jgi:hypothetical protein